MSSTNTKIRTLARLESIATFALIELGVVCAMLLGPLWLLAPLALSVIIVGSSIRKIRINSPEIQLGSTIATSSLMFAFILTWLIAAGFIGVR